MRAMDGGRGLPLAAAVGAVLGGMIGYALAEEEPPPPAPTTTSTTASSSPATSAATAPTPGTGSV